MKRLIGIIIIFISISCKENSTSPQEILFDVRDLDKLELLNINNYWKGDSITQGIPKTFENYDKYLGGLELSSENKMITIYIFKSQEIAILAIEVYLYQIPIDIIEEENHEIIKEKWWRSSYTYNTIYANQNNVIIYIHDFEKTEERDMRIIANEILNRIKQKCK